MGKNSTPAFVRKGQLVRVGEDDSTRPLFGSFSIRSTQANPFTNTRVWIVRSANYLWPVSKKRRLESLCVTHHAVPSLPFIALYVIFPPPGILKRVLKRAEGGLAACGGQTITIMS